MTINWQLSAQTAFYGMKASRSTGSTSLIVNYSYFAFAEGSNAQVSVGARPNRVPSELIYSCV